LNKKKNAAVFLDRDGVINHPIFRNGNSKPIAPWSMDEFCLIKDIGEHLRELIDEQYHLIIVTNQPDISKGIIDTSLVEKMNDKIMKTFPIDEIAYCPHEDFHRCECRKPKPGMILKLAKKWSVNLDASFMIGDGWKDIQAGISAGCKTIILDREYNKGTEADFHVKSIAEAVKIIKGEINNEFH
jgi:D-glycero-D-manno-heptose 1,7-bisphosphate phosphatase